MAARLDKSQRFILRARDEMKRIFTKDGNRGHSLPHADLVKVYGLLHKAMLEDKSYHGHLDPAVADELFAVGGQLLIAAGAKTERDRYKAQWDAWYTLTRWIEDARKR